MRHTGRHNEAAQLFCLIHLDLDHEFSTGRDVHGPTDLGRVIDWHRVPS
jgi:hypothetical protein